MQPEKMLFVNMHDCMIGATCGNCRADLPVKFWRADGTHGSRHRAAARAKSGL